MGTVPVTINGVMYPKGRSGNDAPVPCTIVGQAWISDLSVGGGPMPPQGPVDPGYSPPWAQAPVDPGYSPPWAQVPARPAHPIVLPPDLPPEVTPPEPGSPPVIIPGVKPVQPIVPPPFVVIEYPGIGKVVVPQPVPSAK